MTCGCQHSENAVSRQDAAWDVFVLSVDADNDGETAVDVDEEDPEVEQEEIDGVVGVVGFLL